MMLVTLLVVTAFAGSAVGRADLGGYLPPVHEPCVPREEKRYETRVVTQRIDQPIVIDRTETQLAQAIATAVMAVTSTMVQTETRQVVVPVTRSYEVTARSTSIVVRTNVIPASPVVSTVVRTQVIPTTQVNQRTQTQFERRFQTVQRINTQVQTDFVTQTRVQNVQRTAFFTPNPVFSTVLQTRQEFSTQISRLPDFFSTVTSVQVQTSQAVQFVTPPPVFLTNTQIQTRISTQVQPVVRTQQAFATQVSIREQVVPSTFVQVIRQTSIAFVQRTQTLFRVIDRVFTQTQVIPQHITQTSVVFRVNEQFVTQTQIQHVAHTQTVRGQDRFIDQLITVSRNQVQVVTRTIDNVQQSIIERIVTAPCTQVQQTGYNYNRPSNPLIF